MTAAQGAVIVAATVATAGLLAAAYWHAHRSLQARIAREITSAVHAKLRRRLMSLAGKQMRPPTAKYATRAATMPGWVWFSVTRRPRVDPIEMSGWGLTRRAASRRMEQRVRDETGTAGLAPTLLLVAFVVAVAFGVPFEWLYVPVRDLVGGVWGLVTDLFDG